LSVPVAPSPDADLHRHDDYTPLTFARLVEREFDQAA
jgi:hypothetical protein